MATPNDPSRSHWSISEAIVAALNTQNLGPTGGVGVELPRDHGGFVQWISNKKNPLALDALEVCPGASGVDAELAQAGYYQDPGLKEFGIWSLEASIRFETEAELVAHISGLLSLIGATERMELIAYP